MKFSIPLMRFSGLWLAISGSIVAIALVCLGYFGLTYGVDFTGGTLVELSIPSLSDTSALTSTLVSAGFTDAVVQSGEGSQVFVRMGTLSEEQHQTLLTAVRAAFTDAIEVQYTFVGPAVGDQLRRSAIFAVVLLLVLIALYVAWAFTQERSQVASWKFGVATLVTAAHDVILPLGAFAVLGKFFGYHVDAAFVAAILTILGYSINDTIVVFDRTREHLGRMRAGETFRDLVNRSVNETFARSINTTLAVLIPLFAIFFLGGTSTRPFVLALIIGIAAGAYSSIFVASPLLVLLQERKGKDKTV